MNELAEELRRLGAQLLADFLEVCEDALRQRVFSSYQLQRLRSKTGQFTTRIRIELPRAGRITERTIIVEDTDLERAIRTTGERIVIQATDDLATVAEPEYSEDGEKLH